MLKSFLRNYLEIPKAHQLPTPREVALEMFDLSWFSEYMDRKIETHIQKTLRGYKQEFAVDADRAAKDAIAFVNREDFLDSFVERISKKQLF